MDKRTVTSTFAEKRGCAGKRKPRPPFRAFATGRCLGLVLLTLALQDALALGPVEVPDTWGGDVATRARLGGNWGGARDTLGARGVVLDIDFALTPQAVMSGGRDEGITAWGNTVFTLNVDTGKAGWWPGGFFNVKGDVSYGNAGLGEVGAIVPPNMSTLVPAALDEDAGLESATFTQFLSPKIGLTVGKVYTFDLAHGEFKGNMHTQFMNTAFNLPMVTAPVPISAYGGGLVLLPAPSVSVFALALDASGKVTEDDVADAFDEGVTFLGAASLKVNLFGRVGHQTLMGTWSDKTRLSLDQDPSNVGRLLLTERFPRLGNPGPLLERILADRFPGLLVPVQPAAQEEETWAISYGFEQYVWQPDGDPARGLGVFFNVGVSDGNPNPVEYSWTLGIGGKGMLPGRGRDSFGAGWARTEFSDEFVPFLRERLPLGLENEDVFEIYYNASITPWLNVSPSIQVLDAALESTLKGSNRLEEVDTAAVFLLRTFVRF